MASTSDRYHTFRLLQELDRGIANHMAWLRDLHRGLICQEVDNRTPDLMNDAHTRCRFGKWLQGASAAVLDEPMFHELEVIHQEMHDSARDMLNEWIATKSVGTGVYTRFMDMAIQFKLSVRQFETRLVEKICVVDLVTGAWNRQAMHYRLAQEQERLVRTGGTCCICMVDLDHFKKVNDQFGHPVGDMVLRELAVLLGRSLRKYDAVYRYGGEEFLLFFPVMEQPAALDLVERIRKQVEEMTINVPEHAQPLRITASFGISCLSGKCDMDTVIANADHALMWAKADGRNCVRIWDGEQRDFR